MESYKNQYSGVFEVSIGVQTYADASTGDIFLKKSVFFSQKLQMSGRYQALVTYVAADFELILSILESYSLKKGKFDLFWNKRMTNSVEQLRDVHHFNVISTHSTFGDIGDVSMEFVSTEFKTQRKI